MSIEKDILDILGKHTEAFKILENTVRMQNLTIDMLNKRIDGIKKPKVFNLFPIVKDGKYFENKSPLKEA